MSNDERGFELFANGGSVSSVAKELSVSWYVANQMKKRFEEKHGTPQASAAETVEEVGEVEAFDLTVTVPVGRVDAIFASFTDAEKMSAVQATLQARVDAI